MALTVKAIDACNTVKQLLDAGVTEEQMVIGTKIYMKSRVRAAEDRAIVLAYKSGTLKLGAAH